MNARVHPVTDARFGRGGVDVAVVGAGIIGQSIAWRCAGRGLRVAVLDPRPGEGASRVAAGMLAPVGEASFGEHALTALQVESLRRWPGFAAELTAATGVDVGYRTEGTLTVALTHDDLAVVRRMHDYQRGLGLEVEPLPGADARRREPLLHPRVRGGTFAPGDHQVDPRAVLRALSAALTAAGVTIERRAVHDLDDVAAPVVVLAAAAGVRDLTGLPARPVKGQLLRLRTPAREPALHYTVRGLADGRSVYLVPRRDGELVVGATVEERGDGTVTAGAVLGLLRAATDLVPAVGEYELVEACAGQRPATPDNAPWLGELPSRGGRRLVVATGHYRHGVLLTPVTADAVAELVATARTPEVIAPFDPGRAGGGRAQVEPARREADDAWN